MKLEFPEKQELLNYVQLVAIRVDWMRCKQLMREQNADACHSDMAMLPGAKRQRTPEVARDFRHLHSKLEFKGT